MDAERKPTSGQRHGWDQWQVDPESLWPDFGASSRGSGSQPRGDHRDAQRHETARRHPDRARPRLTREEIVDAAIAIADAEGAGALSMRRIAQVLRSGTMSLYWHVASKEHLLELMRDMLMAEIEVTEPTGDWRADLRALAVSTRAMLRRHRWLMEFAGGRPPLAPNTLIGLERALAIMAKLELEPGMAFGILTAVNTYVTGTVMREAQEMRTQQIECELRIDDDAAEPARAAWRDRLADTGLFPNLVGFLDARGYLNAPETMDEGFEFGLDSMLDGIAARISH